MKHLQAIFLLLLVSVEARAQGTEAFAVVGVDTSVNLGDGPGAVFGIRVEDKRTVTLESRTSFDTSRKIDGGWRFSQLVSLRIGGRYGAVTGLGFRYRDGGPWTKKAAWVVLGGSARTELTELRLTYRHPVYESYPNFVRVLEGEFRWQGSKSKFGMILTEGLVFHQNYTAKPRRYGWFQTMSVTIALNKR